MIEFLHLIFYVAATLFLYNYVIYPAFIIVLSKRFSKKNITNNVSKLSLPKVSFIIAAYNEEAVIEKKIINTLSLNYPTDLFQVIVVSDGSTDSTNHLVEKHVAENVVSLHENKRNGKSAALNRGVEFCNGEIIVFSDANNDFSENSIHELVKHFENKNIGAVTGAKHIYSNQDRQSSKGDGLYWKYESKIKQAESDLGSITGAEGEILAVRRSLYKPIDKDLINDDAAITFSIVKSGYRIIYEKNAQAFEEASKDLIDDFNVKVRMTAGGFQTLSKEKRYLFPPLNWFTFTFISHKVLRWFAPHFMIITFIIPFFLIDRIEMKAFSILQVLFYLLSLYGWINRNKVLSNLVYIPMYFTVMNIALFWGFIRFFNNNTKSIWKKAER